MAAIREVFTLDDQFTATLTRYITLGVQAAGVTEDLQASLINIETATAATATAVDRLTNQLMEMNTTSRQATAGADALLGKLKSLFATYAGMQGIKTLVGLSDTLAQTTARLDMMNDGLQTTAELNQMIYESAQRSRGSYQATADMVAKLGNLAGDAFNSSAELVDFAEQLNKQITLSGASTQAADAAMLQLTQAMSSGMLRGEELNSILEQTPTIAQSIAEYMGVSTGVMKQMASEGAITANVVKNALFEASEGADGVNARFEQMPMTWAQVWTSFKNTATMAIQPVLSAVNKAANYVDDAIQWASDNMPLIEAGLAGLAAGAVAVGSAMVASAASSAIAWAAANFWLLAIVGAVSMVIFAARQAGATWEEIGNVIGSVLGALYASVMNSFLVPAQNGFAAFANFIGNVFNDPVTAIKVLFYDMALTVLGYIRSVVGGIKTIINAVTGAQFSLTAPIDNLYNQLSSNREAAIAADSYKEFVKAWDYVDPLEAIKSGGLIGSNLGSKLDNFDLSNMLGSMGNFGEWAPDTPTYDQINNLNDSVKGIEKSVNMSEEDLKMLIDNAERRYISNVNLTSQTPVINITGANTGDTAADRKALADAIQTVLVEQLASTSVRATAVPT